MGLFLDALLNAVLADTEVPQSGDGEAPELLGSLPVAEGHAWGGSVGVQRAVKDTQAGQERSREVSREKEWEERREGGGERELRVREVQSQSDQVERIRRKESGQMHGEAAMQRHSYEERHRDRGGKEGK